MVIKEKKNKLKSTNDTILHSKEDIDKKLVDKIAKKHFKLYKKLAE